uniref:Unspecific monooxygenase n=1 Tax=Steinernema glaseri TaxID=37863 RepID=A0A1I7ZHH8_9BILA
MPRFGHLQQKSESRAELDSGEHTLNYDGGGDDYLDAYMIMLERKKEKGEFLGWFTDENLAVNLGDLWMAGNMTTLETMQWFLIFCLNTPGVQEKMRAEAFSITNGNRHVLMTDRPYMPYTNAVVTEVLRCGSIFNFNLIHETTRETVVGGYIIPKRTTLTSQISVIMKDEENFKDATKFDPERYIRDPDVVKKVIPFSVGKRSCVGESLARAEMFLITSNFVQKYKFSNIDDNTPPTMEEIFPALFQKRSRRLRMRIDQVVY